MAGDVKLTKAQMETLIDVERGGEIGAKYVEYYIPIKKLLEFGLVMRRDGKYGSYFVITPAGLAALTRSQP
jgi:hypothetical protein